MKVYISNLHSTRDELLGHFSIPFWLHILIGQGYVCAIKHAKADWLMTCAKADWLMTCAKADWLRTDVLTFFLPSDWLVQNLPLF